MARSNGPSSPPPGAGRAPRPDPQSWAQGTTPRPANTARPLNPALGLPASQPAGFQPQSAGAAYQQAAYSAQQQPAQGDQRYAQPQRVQVSEPRTAPPQRPANSNAFDTFVAQQAPSNGYAGNGYQGYDNAPAQRQPASYPALTPAQAPYGDAGSEQHGFGHWSNAPAADARGFDYGSYGGVAAAPAGNAAQGQGGYSQQPQFGPDTGYGAQDEWGNADGYDQQEPSLDASGYGHDQHGYNGEHGALEQSYAEDDEYEDEPRPRRKLTLIAAAVAGALMCGGGLAYGYKTFLGPVTTASNAPLIKTSSIPSKVKPDDPGGRKFAHSEPSIMGGGANKVMGEPLTDGGAGGPSSADSARKVQTVEVRPDGSVVPSSGETMSDARPAPMTASSMEFPTAGAPVGNSFDSSPSAPPAPPQVMARAEPSSPPPAAAREEPVVEEAPAAVAPPKKVQAKKVAAAAAPEGPIGAAPTGAGWVAVLASVPVSSSSQMDSLKQFADMQQKYGDVLGDKTPSVQEANLGEKGRYHRLVVGPPSSRDSASSICGSLKTAGFTGCWVAQY